MSDYSGQMSSYAKAANSLLGSLSPKSRRELFADISNENTRIIDILLSEARRAQKDSNYKEANRFIDIAQLVLANNKRFQDMVGDILTKSE